jgi:hypothetical protein
VRAVLGEGGLATSYVQRFRRYAGKLMNDASTVCTQIRSYLDGLRDLIIDELRSVWRALCTPHSCRPRPEQPSLGAPTSGEGTNHRRPLAHTRGCSFERSGWRRCIPWVSQDLEVALNKDMDEQDTGELEHEIRALDLNESGGQCTASDSADIRLQMVSDWRRRQLRHAVNLALEEHVLAPIMEDVTRVVRQEKVSARRRRGPGVEGGPLGPSSCVLHWVVSFRRASCPCRSKKIVASCSA